jgi:hypothetical protein
VAMLFCGAIWPLFGPRPRARMQIIYRSFTIELVLNGDKLGRRPGQRIRGPSPTSAVLLPQPRARPSGTESEIDPLPRCTRANARATSAPRLLLPAALCWKRLQWLVIRSTWRPKWLFRVGPDSQRAHPCLLALLAEPLLGGPEQDPGDTACSTHSFSCAFEPTTTVPIYSASLSVLVRALLFKFQHLRIDS